MFRGELKIAEVASRFTDVDAFTSLISSIGFKLKSSVRLSGANLSLAVSSQVPLTG